VRRSRSSAPIALVLCALLIAPPKAAASTRGQSGPPRADGSQALQTAAYLVQEGRLDEAEAQAQTALTDPATAVRSKALAVAAQLPDERYIPRIVECLRKPDLRLAARSALAAFPAGASLAALAAALDRECPSAERKLLVHALRSCLVPQAYPVLLDLMEAHQPSISGEASDAMLCVRRGGSPPDPYRTLVNDRWKMLTRTAYGLTQALRLLPDGPNGSDSQFDIAALDHRFQVRHVSFILCLAQSLNGLNSN
jgi:HEAT repeat protein